MVASEGSGYGSAYVPVLASNDYALADGESSIFAKELGGTDKEACGVAKRKLLIAGRDYAHEDTCLACFVEPQRGASKAAASTFPIFGSASSAAGGCSGASLKRCSPASVLRCKLCPMAFHRACATKLGLCEVAGPIGGMSFTCPQHACSVCTRKATAAGGMLFRCEACPTTFCEDCLPRDASIVGCSARLEARGVKLPNQACYVRCSARCEAFMARGVDSTKPPKFVMFQPLELDALGAEAEVGAEAGAEAGKASEGGTTEAATEAGMETATSCVAEAGGALFSKLFEGVIGTANPVSEEAAAKFGPTLRSLLLEFGQEHGDSKFYTVPSVGPAAKQPFLLRMQGLLFGKLPKKSLTGRDAVQSLLDKAVREGELLPYSPLQQAGSGAADSPVDLEPPATLLDGLGRLAKAAKTETVSSRRQRSKPNCSHPSRRTRRRVRLSWRRSCRARSRASLTRRGRAC